MASIITATTTSGLTQSADNSGVLQLASGTGNLVTVPAVTGTVMVSGNMPTFSAYQNSNQSYSSGVSTLINFQAENWDTASCFNNTGSTVGSIPAYAFLPSVAGYYQVNLLVRANNTNNESQAAIYKNGSAWCNGSCINIASGTNAGSTASSIVYLNGTTDYIQGYVYNGSAGTGSGNNQSTQFSAIMVRGA
jgi:hypothetical protein